MQLAVLSIQNNIDHIVLKFINVHVAVQKH